MMAPSVFEMPASSCNPRGFSCLATRGVTLGSSGRWHCRSRPRVRGSQPGSCLRGQPIRVLLRSVGDTGGWPVPKIPLSPARLTTSSWEPRVGAWRRWITSTVRHYLLNGDVGRPTVFQRQQSATGSSSGSVNGGGRPPLRHRADAGSAGAAACRGRRSPVGPVGRSEGSNCRGVRVPRGR